MPPRRAPAGVDHQVAGLEPTTRDGGEAGELAGRRAGNCHPGRPPGRPGQAGAVKGVRAFRTPAIRLAPLGEGIGHGLGGWGGRPPVGSGGGLGELREADSGRAPAPASTIPRSWWACGAARAASTVTRTRTVTPDSAGRRGPGGGG